MLATSNIRRALLKFTAILSLVTVAILANTSSAYAQSETWRFNADNSTLTVSGGLFSGTNAPYADKNFPNINPYQVTLQASGNPNPFNQNVNVPFKNTTAFTICITGGSTEAPEDAVECFDYAAGQFCVYAVGAPPKIAAASGGKCELASSYTNDTRSNTLYETNPTGTSGLYPPFARFQQTKWITLGTSISRTSTADTNQTIATCLADNKTNCGIVASATTEQIQSICSTLSDPARQAACEENAAAATEAGEDAEDPCAGIQGDGADAVRWLVCPAAQGGSAFVSTLDGWITDWLRYDNETLDSLQGVWEVFRNIAFGLLVVVGLIIVISQAAGAQILDAYTIRKALPRLLIAVLFMVLSWPILTFIVGFFNDLGGMTQSLILSPLASQIDPESLNGGSIVSGLLSGGGIFAAGAGVAGLGVLLGWAGISSLLLVGLLSVALLAFILGVRWVLITACIVFAPIAILAFVLPNTEKIWQLWLNGFIGALATFPLVMAVLALGKAAALLLLN